MSLFRKKKKNDLNPFMDVFPGDYYYDAVLWAVQNGVVKGTKPDAFDPQSGCTRGQAITMVWRAAGSPKPAATVSPFIDVKETDYCFEAIMWAVEQGIGSEIGQGIFAANASCARGQFLSFMHRSLGAPEATVREHSFLDVKESDFFYEAALWAVEKNITSGMGEGAFGPYALCNRAQVVTFLYRAYNQ